MAKAKSVSSAPAAVLFALTASGLARVEKVGQDTSHRHEDPEFDHGRWRTAEGGRTPRDNSRANVLGALHELGESFTREDGVSALHALRAADEFALGYGRKPAERFSWAIRKGFIKEVVGE